MKFGNSFSKVARALPAAALMVVVSVAGTNAQGVKREIVQPGWEAKYTFSPAVVTEGGKIVWVAGHGGFVDDNNKSLAGDFDAQARQAFKNIQRTLAKAGATLNDVVTMTVYVSDVRYSKRFTEIRAEFYPKDFPASTLITTGFALPEMMVEITPVAVISK